MTHKPLPESATTRADYPAGAVTHAGMEGLLERIMVEATQYAAIATDHDTAREVAQQICIYVWNSWLKDRSGWRVPEHLESWVRGAARRRIADLMRSRAERQMTYEAYEALRTSVKQFDGSDPDQDLEYNALEARVGAILDAMPERQREAFIRVRDGGLTHEQVAADRKISVQTVETHVARAMRALRDGLKGHVGAEWLKATRGRPQKPQQDPQKTKKDDFDD